MCVTPPLYLLLTTRTDKHTPREVLLGITGADYTIIAASRAAMRGATILKASDDKTRILNDHCIMAYSGEAGDTGTISTKSTFSRHDPDLHMQSNLQNMFKPTSLYTQHATHTLSRPPPSPPSRATSWPRPCARANLTMSTCSWEVWT